MSQRKCVGKESVSFGKFAGLVSLIEKNKLENTYKSYGTDISFRMFIKMIAEQMQVELMNEIRALRFLSVSSDGFTDSGVFKQEITYIRFVHDGLPIRKFVDIVHFHKADTCNNYQRSNLLTKRTFSSDFKPKVKVETNVQRR